MALAIRGRHGRLRIQALPDAPGLRHAERHPVRPRLRRSGSGHGRHLHGPLHGPLRQAGGKTRHGNHGVPALRGAGLLRRALPGPQNGGQGARPALHGRPHSRPGGPDRVVLDHAARGLAQQIQPRRGIHRHDSRHPALRLVLLGIPGLLAGTAPHQPLPRRHGTVGRGGLPGRQLRGPVAQRLRHATPWWWGSSWALPSSPSSSPFPRMP